MLLQTFSAGHCKAVIEKKKKKNLKINAVQVAILIKKACGQKQESNDQFCLA